MFARRTLSALSFLAVICHAQHYCWPCATPHGVVGKWTNSASDAPALYDNLFKYLNNVVPGAHNDGDGTATYFKAEWDTDVVEAWDVAPNVLAAESNECGTFAGSYELNITDMSDHDKLLVEQGYRLETGELHQCVCSLQGRAHIINGSTQDLYDWSQMVEEYGWDANWTAAVARTVVETTEAYLPVLSDEEAAVYSASNIFGVHNVGCPFHRSGPCALVDVESGVRRAWSIESNFSRGYVPLMDNNLLLWTETLGPLLDAFQRDALAFYPMRWLASDGREMYSVMYSPGGKVLIEVVAEDTGGRGREQFYPVSHSRAVLDGLDLDSSVANEPAGEVDRAARPLAPLRISRGVGASRIEATLAFYGVAGDDDARANAAALGFGHAKILLDEEDERGDRAVTIMLSPNATVHLQLWVREEGEEDEPRVESDTPLFPTDADFVAANNSNQVQGLQPESPQPFCAHGKWTVDVYNDYVLKTHESVMTEVDVDDFDGDLLLHPPAGAAMDVFLDDHLSFDCTSPIECDLAKGGLALYRFGSRIQWLGGSEYVAAAPYSYDPTGYGIELHWYSSSDGFEPSGPVVPSCFSPDSKGTCPGNLVE